MNLVARFYNRIALAACALTALAPTIAFAQSITFANIADTTTTNGGAFSSFNSFGTPSINASGTVAFLANLDAGGSGIFTNTAGSNTASTIADRTNTNNGAFNSFSIPSINASGTVAFVAFLDAGGSAIFTNTAGSNTAATVADRTTTNGGAFNSFNIPTINASGTVAFLANLDTGSSGIFTNTVGSNTATTVANFTTTNNGAFSNFAPIATINASGTVAFGADLDAGGAGIFTNTAGNTTAATVADSTTTNGGAFNSFGNASINASGTVVFLANLDAGGASIFTNTAGSGTASTVADEATGFFNLGEPSINASGTVAFLARRNTGPGIFAALSGSNVPFAVVQRGDSLFGSTISSLDFFRDGLSDGNALAFQYTLADGRSGIAVANISAVAVPEAGTLALAAFGLLAGAGVAVRRRTVR